MTRSPFSRVGAIETLGIQNICSRRLRTMRATITATATVTTQLSAELRWRRRAGGETTGAGSLTMGPVTRRGRGWRRSRASPWSG
jgi:hypothetical protein